MSEGQAEATFKVEKSGDSVVIGCPEQLDISMVNELHELLSEQIGQCAAIEFDAGQVERADAAALQLLTVLSKDAKSQEISVKWRNPSETFKNAASLLGLQNDLGLAPAG
jgi:ABC-type transporter Mla MlaB component